MDKTIKIWDLKIRDLKMTLKGHNDWITSLLIDEKSNELISGSGRYDWID